MIAICHLSFVGGAHKFEKDIHREVNMKLNKFDEIDSLVHGVEFMVTNNNDPKSPEVFYYTELNENTGVKQVNCNVLNFVNISLLFNCFLGFE